MINRIARHPAILYKSEMAALCRPLLNLNITYFAHVFIDHDNNLVGINNHADFTEHYLKKKYYNADIHMAAETEFNQPFIVWDDIDLSGESKKMDEESMEFGIKHTFTIIQKDTHGTHYYHFANNQENRAFNQIYLTHIDLLKGFIHYFQEKIKENKHLSDAYQMKFSIDQNNADYNNSAKLLLPTENMKSNLIREISYQNNAKAHSDIFKNTIATLNLSKREKECLYLLIRGRTASLIAAELSLSIRTVETYLLNIKNKLLVNSKKELIEKIFLLSL